MRGPWVLLALATACGDPTSKPVDASIDTAIDGKAVDAPLDADPNMPMTLADTGLCANASCTQINSGIYAFTPQFPLYSDGATKKRWIYLPPGTTIDTSNMDFWKFPVGTKLWKEFTDGTTRVETRLEMKVGPGDTVNDWFYAAYVWNSTQDATHFAEYGEPDANGTQHDVPGKITCRQCHENVKPSRVLGFSAIQLDRTGAAGELDLADVIAMGWLSAPPTAPSSGPYFPFDATNTIADTAALGYLHANCGHCHNPTSTVIFNTPMVLRLTVGTIGTRASTGAYTTAVGVDAATAIGGHTKIVNPGNYNQSVMIDRFESTNAALRMPAVGVEIMDPDGDTTLKTWIQQIP